MLHLARWLASNWWRLRWEPVGESLDWRLSHEVGAAGGGFTWPTLRFDSDGERVRLVARATSSPHVADVRFLHNAEVWLTASAFEHAIDDFIERVIERLDTVGAPDGALSEMWSCVREDRGAPEASRLRRVEALLGVDPDEIEPETLTSWLAAGGWLGERAVEEVLAATGTVCADTTLDRLRHVSADTSLPSIELSKFATLWVTSPRPQPPGVAPWARGSALAAATRKRLGLGAEPISREQLSDILEFDAEESAAPASNLRLGVGFRTGDNSSMRVCLRRRHPLSRRFEAARLLGDALLSTDVDVLSPVTDRSTARQRLQRAFAQEFLCPVDALASMVSLPSPHEDELLEAAEHFRVSEFAVRSALVNRELVGRHYLPGPT